MGQAATSGDLQTLAPLAMRALPLASVRPLGWLRDQLTLQANGLTGYLDEFWPSVSQSAWLGRDGDAWERGPYYLDGLVPLAHLLDDQRLISKVNVWLQAIAATAKLPGRDDGWFGPAKNTDRWPLAIALKGLTQAFEGGYAPAMRVIDDYFYYLHSNAPDWPDSEWRGVRAMENVVSLYWRYELQDACHPVLLKIARSIHEHSFDWTRYFLEFPQKEPVTPATYQFRHWTHVVNVAMAIKYPGLWYRQSGDERDRRAVYEGIANLDRYHGQPGGRFSGDEHLSGCSPTQGTELCAVVEYMYSLEKLLEVFGDVAMADRLEMLAYNALPGTCTPDMWTHQYDQQANQVLCTVAKRAWSNNGDESNIYGLEPNFGCCTANMHQGWPKFVAHLWMGTPDGGLAAVAYGPSRMQTTLAGGRRVVIVEETDYPFDSGIRLTIHLDQPTRFPLHLRVPHWAADASISIGRQTQSAPPGSFVVLHREWNDGDAVTLEWPMQLRSETRFNGAASILRGPLVFALQIGEQFRRIRSHHDTLPSADWEIAPATPWNYGLQLDRDRPERWLEIETRGLSKVPWAGDAAPIVLRGKGRLLPQWRLEQNSAGPTPPSPARSAEPLVDVTLAPYGSTRLRISEFPVLAPDEEASP